ncbi:hypothetical protein KP509_35G037400 [Ceratopteris richardii]|nr:hypothetical protein KP509_35G037400 [Ceratopteris richardii]
MYGECCALSDARAHLVALQSTDVSPWNLMIRTYIHHNNVKEALELLELMLQQQIEPNRTTILSILRMSSESLLIHLAHYFAVDVGFVKDIVIENTLIAMYGKFGSVDDAFQVFKRLPESDIVTWNALIMAYAQNGMSQMSICTYMQMKQECCFPDEITFVSLLDACADGCALREGCRLHVNVLSVHLESGILVGTALVNMYGKCGLPEYAWQSFNVICQKNTVCWTAMITAYAQNERGNDALQLFTLMEQEGFCPNRITFVSAINACGIIPNLSWGEKLFNRIKNSPLMEDIKVSTALINMFGRCGKLDYLKEIFDNLKDPDVAAWNAMIAVCAKHGQSKYVIQLLNEMTHSKVRPDIITYTNILSMCSSAGLIHEACGIFKLLEDDCGVNLVEHHQNCIIDLLAKAGKLGEAELLVQGQPIDQSSYIPSMTLLAACNNHVDVKRGRQMVQLLFKLGQSSKNYDIIISGVRAGHSVYRITQHSNESSNKPLEGHQGKSLIRLGGRVHEFLPNDMSHPLIDDVYEALLILTTEMQREGHFSCINQRDLESFNQREHTGMLASMLGVISTSPGKTLYITKDTNLCSICHMIIEYMSKVSSHKITIKDASCLHEFEHGVCSCANVVSKVSLLTLSMTSPKSNN